jgi:multisubunit Na+/H+ antiporter MnhB subunit
MFQLNILQDQWAVLALFGGVAAALVIVLSYVAFWRTEAEAPDPPPAAAQRRQVPWILIVLYAIIIVYAVAYVARNVMNPPTW